MQNDNKNKNVKTDSTKSRKTGTAAAKKRTAAAGRKRKKKNAKNRQIITGLVIAVAAVCIIALLIGGMGSGTHMVNKKEMFHISSDEDTGVVVNGKVLETPARKINGANYILYTDVWNYINSGFYLEGDTLYMTLPEGTKTWTPDDGTGCLYKDGEDYYISDQCIIDNSDIEYQVYSDPDRIVIRNKWNGVYTAGLTSDSKIRQRNDERSDIVTEAVKGQTVAVLEEGEEWTSVTTEDGFTGYVKNDSLSDKTELTHEADSRYVFPSASLGQTVKMIWHYIDSNANNIYLDGMMADAGDVNVISPTWFRIADAAGNMTTFADTDYVNKAHNTYGLSIWALVGDYLGEDSTTGKIISSEENRQRIISQMIETAVNYSLQGINVDFETITMDQAPAYLQFLRELKLAAAPYGLIISTDNYVPTYTGYYKRSEQSKIVDYVIIMGYDEHTGSSDEIGSVASLPFVEQGVEDTLLEVPAEKTVLAVPFYTRGWVEKFGSTGFESVHLNMTEIQSFIDEHNITTQWDDSVGQYVGSASDSEATYSIWVEDAASLELKLKLISKYGLAGASAWRIGIETQDVWEVWKNCLG